MHRLHPELSLGCFDEARPHEDSVLIVAVRDAICELGSYDEQQQQMAISLEQLRDAVCRRLRYKERHDGMLALPLLLLCSGYRSMFSVHGTVANGRDDQQQRIARGAPTWEVLDAVLPRQEHYSPTSFVDDSILDVRVCLLAKTMDDESPGGSVFDLKATEWCLPPTELSMRSKRLLDGLKQMQAQLLRGNVQSADSALQAFRKPPLVQGAVFDKDENAHTEFKAGMDIFTDPARSWEVAKYVCAYLNSSRGDSKGGTLYFGICDDGTVRGVQLSRAQWDELQQQVAGILGPCKSSRGYRGERHQYVEGYVFGRSTIRQEQWAIDRLPVKSGSSQDLYVVVLRVLPKSSWPEACRDQSYLVRDDKCDCGAHLV